MEVSVKAPYIKRDKLGGINNPNVPPPAKLPTTIESSYFLFDNSGYATEPTAAAVDKEEPLIAPKTVQTAMFVWSNPPGILLKIPESEL